jgi:tagaturonate reductase
MTVDSTVVEPPRPDHFAYPEKVLQFGTGAFLRGFVEYFFDRANRDGSFAGRIVLVGSTGSGRADMLGRQDGLFTLCTRGLREGRPVDDCSVIASISRAVSAHDEWDAVMGLAESPDLEIIVSNTTEVGIQLDPSDRLDLSPPASFPGKLAAVLARRAAAFGHDPARGLIILPCELIEDNGGRLRSIVLDLARRSGLDDHTVEWIGTANTFCNTLVDCIVTGFPGPEEYEELAARVNYEDPMMTVAEPYRLWAIEGDAPLASRLDFLARQQGVVVTPDITDFRERKVRLLNGTHTLIVPVSLLYGNATVGETMLDEVTATFTRRLMLKEIVPSLPGDREQAHSFATDVLDRFANPYIRHELKSIALQQTSKMQVRVFPSLRRYVVRFGELPPLATFGFAALIWLKREWLLGAGEGLPRDNADDRWLQIFKADSGLDEVAGAVCSDRILWEEPPAALDGFTARVAEYLAGMSQAGPKAVLDELIHSQAASGPV